MGSKHAVVGLARVWARSLAEHGIRVNTVHPTGVNTPMVVNEAFGRFVEEVPEMVSRFQHLLPVALVEPIDISNAITLLCSDEGRYTRGQALAVDAGSTTR